MARACTLRVRRTAKLVTSTVFELLILMLIVVNGTLLGVQTAEMPSRPTRDIRITQSVRSRRATRMRRRDSRPVFPLGERETQ